jgi:hypothetical protein
MNLSMSRLSVIAPAVALVFIGVASVAFSWGASTGGPHAAPPSPAEPSPAATGRANPRVGAGTTASVVGTVASKTASAIIVTTLSGQSVTVDVSPATIYSVRGVTAATLNNIAIGDRIAAQGTPNADGSFTATLVHSGGGSGGRGPGGGRSRGGGFGLPTPAPSAAPSGPST